MGPSPWRRREKRRRSRISCVLEAADPAARPAKPPPLPQTGYHASAWIARLSVGDCASGIFRKGYNVLSHQVRKCSIIARNFGGWFRRPG